MKKKITIKGADYWITENGEVYGKSGKLIKQRPDTSGYSSFTAGVKGDRTRVRTYLCVARLYVPNPNNFPEVDHLDSNIMNPKCTNLEWVTHEENVRRSFERGHHKNNWKGTRNPKCNLTEEKVLNIRKLYNEGMEQHEISKLYNIPWSTIHNIVMRNTWKNI